MYPSRGTVRYEERGQGYRDVEKVGKHWTRLWAGRPSSRVLFAEKKYKKFISFSKESRPSLLPTQPPVQ